jgi:membrane fusion protein, multidrug efflux system
VITQRNVHPGALVSAEGKEAKPMLELKEVDRLRLQVDIPENFAATLRNNDTVSFVLSSFPGVKRSGRISRKSMNISSEYRSERVELDVYNPDGSLAPGMYADLLFNSKGALGALAVPKTAIVTSSERKYVLLIRDGRVHKVDVNTGNETNDKIEVYGDLEPGQQVVANATDEIKDDSPLQ